MNPDFSKYTDGLMPAIIQDSISNKVLMLGFMNEESFTKTKTEKKCFDWAREAVDLGAGEILLTSMNHDGTKNGFAIEITKLLSETLPVPIIASGGAGNMEHFVEVFEKASADAALAASIFHFKEIPIPDLKQFLHRKNITVRL